MEVLKKKKSKAWKCFREVTMWPCGDEIQHMVSEDFP